MKIQKPSLQWAVGAVLASSALMSTSPAQACDPEPYIASVCMTAATFCPRGYAEANGALMPISQYSALFSLMGTTYGGDGRTTFALPDLRGRSAIGWGQAPGLSMVRQGEKRGTEQTTLTTTNLPSHNHAATFTPSGATAVKASTSVATKTIAAAGDFIASDAGLSGVKKFIPGDEAGTTVDLGGVSGVSGGDVSVNPTGGGQSFSNLPPQLGMRYCVALQGIFPSRN